MYLYVGHEVCVFKLGDFYYLGINPFLQIYDLEVVCTFTHGRVYIPKSFHFYVKQSIFFLLFIVIWRHVAKCLLLLFKSFQELLRGRTCAGHMPWLEPGSSERGKTPWGPERERQAPHALHAIGLTQPTLHGLNPGVCAPAVSQTRPTQE